MPLKCGIIGMPNVGKSTLFNALTASTAAEVANYPFCTIEPNFGSVNVPDQRLNILAGFVNSEKISPTTIEFIDIAGLVKGASQGEGLGNKFLSHIKSVDAILHVIRCFENEKITSVNSIFDPIKDLEIINTELMLADINTAEQRLTKINKDKTLSKEEIAKYKLLLEQYLQHLNEGKFLGEIKNLEKIPNTEFLTSKPVIYVCNVSEEEVFLNTENKYYNQILDIGKKSNIKNLKISSKLEYELSEIKDKLERENFLKSLGIHNSSLDKIIKLVYNVLNLKSFYTIGKKESKSWSFVEGIIAEHAAGLIHSDIKDGFIKAEVVKYQDYIEYKDINLIREKGKVRIEGKNYKVQDSDTIVFKFRKNT